MTHEIDRWNKPDHFKCAPKEIIFFILYLSLLMILWINIPKQIWIYYQQRSDFVVMGFLGIWRYSWWAIHVIRSLIYANLVFPHRRLMATQLWKTGWRPPRMFILMTTFNELPDTTHTVLRTLLSECNSINVPATLVIGTGSSFDEEVIASWLENQEVAFPFEVIFVRQRQPGKRYAIGDALRVIQNNGLCEEDPVVFMDGDTWLGAGCLEKCLPFFHLYPNLQALTTYEQADLRQGPLWMQKWLQMRFVQRDFTMHSYALSNKVMTLTGRMSIFRGKHLLQSGFLKVIEEDHLDNWLWGKYRFLSGDDKSTWYYLLKNNSQMMYVPDATTITIEYCHGSSLDRMIENLRRWCGNTLRNGMRAISLGPRKTGIFIWWCLIDQRISIWTLLTGHMIILIAMYVKTVSFILVAILWIAFSRLCTSMILFYFARRMDLTFPFLLYFNQLTSALVKVSILFRLPRQKWKNRGNQQAGFGTSREACVKNWIASYLTLLYCSFFFIMVLLYLDIISLPTLSDLKIPGI